MLLVVGGIAAVLLVVAGVLALLGQGSPASGPPPPNTLFGSTLPCEQLVCVGKTLLLACIGEICPLELVKLPARGVQAP